jgi:DNA-directed RNA polymerase specialized sigma24 family protein
MSSQQADDELSQRLVDGDHLALEEILDSFGPRMALVLKKSLGLSAEDAEDVLVEWLVKVWNGKARFDQRQPLWPWLITIGLNEGRRLVSKSRTGDGSALHYDMAMLAQRVAGQVYEDIPPTSGTLRKLQLILRSLPESDRIILLDPDGPKRGDPLRSRTGKEMTSNAVRVKRHRLHQFIRDRMKLTAEELEAEGFDCGQREDQSTGDSEPEAAS